jgi:hypothetical protein
LNLLSEEYRVLVAAIVLGDFLLNISVVSDNTSLYARLRQLNMSAHFSVLLGTFT